MTKNPPMATDVNGGRDPNNGRFGRGNQAAKGRPSPQAARIQKLREAIIDTVKPSDVRAIVERLIADAKGGDTTATKLLLERIFGPPRDVDMEERLSAIEEMLEGVAHANN